MDQAAGAWDAGVEYAALSDIGLRRSNNQDSSAMMVATDAEMWRRRGHLFMVADGMGAHAAGELASKLAADTIPHTYSKLLDEPPAAAVIEAVFDANTRIFNRGQANTDFQGMGTTSSVLLLLPQGAVVAQVGDSRVYRLRGDRIEQLSFDHSLLWELTASGQLPKDQAHHHVPKNVITRSLGPNATVKVDLEGPFPLAPGDMFLLCSDGLSNVVTNQEMGALLTALPTDQAARMLVDLANLRGGPDNITVVVIRVTGEHIAQGTSAGPLPDVGAPKPPPKPLPAMAWVVLAGMTVVTLLFAVMGFLLAAIVTAAAMAGTFWYLRRPPASSFNGSGGKLGRGPHASDVCESDRHLVGKLGPMTEQLRGAATQENWSIDWDQFNAHRKLAMDAVQKEDFPLALREYCQAISFMMSELRSQRSKRPSVPSSGATGGLDAS